MRPEKKVNFIIIGVQKCGTTSLAYQLAQHPQISFCKHKEPDYFSKNCDWRKNLNTYHSLYAPKSNQITGEASTTYSWFLEYPDTPYRLFSYNPNLKLIYIVRDPVERILSHYMHELSKGRIRYPIEREVLFNPTYLHHSFYAVQIRPYLTLFPKEQILFLKFEEYVQNTIASLEKIADFLEINSQLFEHIDLSPQNDILSRKAERRLKSLISPYVRFIPGNFRKLLKAPFLYDIKEKQQFTLKFSLRLWNLLIDDVNEFSKISKLNLCDWKNKYKQYD